MQGYQIAFQFYEFSSVTALQAQLRLTDQNSFENDGSAPFQVMPYTAAATPALINLTLAGPSLSFSGQAPASAVNQGLQFVLWVTAIGTGLALNVEGIQPSVTANYAFLGYSGRGSLVLGNQFIPFPTA